MIPPEETVGHIEAVTVEAVREAGTRLVAGPPTLAAIGPIRTLETLERIAARLAP